MAAPAAFAAALVELLQAPDQGAALAAAGRTLVERHYDWRIVNARVDALYRRLAVCVGYEQEVLDVATT